MYVEIGEGEKAPQAVPHPILTSFSNDCDF